MRFQRIIEAVYHSPWFITAQGYRSVKRIVDRRVLGIGVDASLEDFFNARPDMQIDGNGVAHICIAGVLGKNLSAIEKSSGNTGYEQIISEVAKAHQSARAIMFHVDSPGGSCAGMVETADAIAESVLPTLGHIDTLGASAAYNLVVSCDYIVANKSASVGSIGCIIPWVDESKAWDEMGISWEPITNDEGDLKGTAAGPSLSEAQRESLREYVNDAFAQFKANIVAHRDIKAEAMRGQVFFAPRALDYNLIDAIGDETVAYNKLLARIR